MAAFNSASSMWAKSSTVDEDEVDDGRREDGRDDGLLGHKEWRRKRRMRMTER